MRVIELFESVTGEVYHYSTLHGATQILTSGGFNLTSSVGRSVADKYAPKGHQFYLSVTRSRLGDYHRIPSRTGVMFVLDGNWFNSRYKSAPVDYWDRAWLGNGRHSEAEDRIFSKTNVIPTLDFVKELHVLFNTPDEQDAARIRSFLLLAKKRNIPAYLYRGAEDWRLQNKAKAIKSSQFKKILRGAIPQKRSYSGYRYLKRWLDVYYHNSTKSIENLPDAGQISSSSRLAYNLKYSWSYDDTQLANDLANERKPGNPGYKDAVHIAKILRDNNWTVKQFVEEMRKKWKAIADKENSEKDKKNAV